jgi:diaminopimelate epimerase
MRLHNADGSIAEMSGNGIRCFAQAVVDGDLAAPGELRVATDAGLRIVMAERTDPATGIANIRVDMGCAVVDSIPVATSVTDHIGGARVCTVDVGNPHLVIEGDPSMVDLTTFGPRMESPYLASSNGINVEVIALADDAADFDAADPDADAAGLAGDAIDMVVWERGVGITQACGTGATAVAVAAHRWGLVGTRVTVRQPGGDAVVEIGDASADGVPVTLVGPSQHIGTITIPRTLVDAVIGRS